VVGERKGRGLGVLTERLGTSNVARAEFKKRDEFRQRGVKEIPGIEGGRRTINSMKGIWGTGKTTPGAPRY